MFLLSGSCFGTYEVGCNIFIMRLWKESADEYLQLLQLVFGIGSLTAPMFVAHFLRQGSVTLDTGSNFDSIFYPYFGLAVLLMVQAFAFLALYLYTRKHENSSLTRNDSVDQDGTSTQSEPVPHVEKLKSSDKWSRIVIVLICVFMHLLIAVEMMFGSFLTTFAVKSDLHLTKVAGAHVTTIFSITWMYGFSCGSLRFVPASFASCSCQPSQFVEPGLDWLTKVVDLVLDGNCASVDQPIQ